MDFGGRSAGSVRVFPVPVIWMLANSFKPDAQITADMNSVAAFIPPAPSGSFFENYVSIILDTSFLRYMANTLFYAAVLIVLSIIVNGLRAMPWQRSGSPSGINGCC